MRGRYGAILAVALGAFGPAALPAGDVRVEENPVPADSFATVRIDLNKGESVIWELEPEPKKVKEVRLTDKAGNESIELHFSGPRGTAYKLRADFFDFATTPPKVYRKKELIRIGADKPAPEPKPDEPVVPDPKPVDPVKTFRVVLVYESAPGTVWKQGHFGVFYGKQVADWLDANTTKDGDRFGWQRRDKDSAPEGDSPLAKLWATARPKATAVPCVAYERNGVVDVVPLDAAPETQIATLAKLREGK